MKNELIKKMNRQEEITKIKKEYYSQVVIGRLLKEMCFPTQEVDFFRELAILNANRISFRGITFSSPQYLKRTLFNEQYSNLNFYGNDANMYVSVARVKQFPNFTFKLRERSKQTKPFFRNRYKDYIYRYDIFFDFDIDYLKKEKSKNEKEKQDYLNKHMIPFLKEIETIITFSKKYKLRIEIVFSGSRGFKILIWNNYLTHEEVTKLLNNIRDVYKFKYCDLAGSFVLSKLMKLNFSLAFKNNKCNMVLPLKEYNYKDFFNYMRKFKNFECFEYEYMKKLNIPKFLMVYTSDFLKRNNGKKGLQNFIKECKLL